MSIFAVGAALLHRQSHRGRVLGRGGRAYNSDLVTPGWRATSGTGVASRIASGLQQARADQQQGEETCQSFSAFGSSHTRAEQHRWQRQPDRVQKTWTTRLGWY